MVHVDKNTMKISNLNTWFVFRLFKKNDTKCDKYARNYVRPYPSVST